MSERFSIYAFMPLRGQRIVEITQYSELRFTTGLFGEASGSLTLPWYSRDSLTAILPNASGLILDDAGTARWSGWVRTREINPEDGIIRFGCKSWFDYYARRRLRSRAGMSFAVPEGDLDMAFNNVDQFRIVGDFLAHAAQIAGAANMPITLRLFGPEPTPTLSGVTRTIVYQPHDRPRIAQLIDDLASQTGGFDYVISVEWNQTVDPWQPALFLDLYYPRKGSDVGGIVIEQGTNANLTRITDDGEEMANPVTALGSGAGDVALAVEAIDPTLLHPAEPAGLYPYLEDELRVTDESDQATLTRRADAELAIRRQPLRTVTARLAEQPRVFHYGDVVIGDSVRTVGSFGGFVVDDRLRIVSETVSVTPTGLSNWSVDLATDDATLRAL
jgi:hypothetical protein